MLASLVLLAALSSPAQAHDDPHAMLAEAHQELRSIDRLVDDADRRSVQEDMHGKIDHLDRLLSQIEAEMGGQGDGVAGVSMHADEHGMSMSVHDGGDVHDHDRDGDRRDRDDDAHDHDHHAPPAGPVACSPDDFAQVQAAVQAESFSDGKKKVLASAAASRWFTVAQVRTLLGAFAFGDDKVDAAATLYPHVADPQNWYQVYDAFTFDSDKAALRQRVGQ